MNGKWQQLDLGGGGLQAANLRLSRILRRRATAWLLLLLLFPAGAHCWYLREHRIATAYPALSLINAAGWSGAIPWAAPAALAALALLLLRDVLTLENRIVACNKRLRMAVYLSQDAAAPAEFRGRFADDDAAGGTRTRRMPTLAEQEAMLREIAARKGGDAGKPR